jgi:hypothetical protein
VRFIHALAVGNVVSLVTEWGEYVVMDIWAAIDDDRSLPLVGQSIDRLHSVDFKWVSNQKSLESKRFVNCEGGPSLHNLFSCSEQSCRDEMRWLLSKCGFST